LFVFAADSDRLLGILHVFINGTNGSQQSLMLQPLNSGIYGFANYRVTQIDGQSVPNCVATVNISGVLGFINVYEGGFSQQGVPNGNNVMTIQVNPY
jgi:hypothetical protein